MTHMTYMTRMTVILMLFSVVANAQQRPNIIFILADDLGYADLSCYGQQKIRTPNIDALAGNGIMFTQFYSGSTVCAPARASFMTGLHTGHAPIRGNKTFEPEGQTPLADSVITFPMLLQRAGYYTAAFGKWSLGFITTSGDPQKKGFETFFGYNCQTLAHDYYPDHLWLNHERIEYPGNATKFNNYSADIIHETAIQFLRGQNKNKPFFFYLPYTLPHADLTVPHDPVYDYYVKKFNEPALQISSPKDTAGKPFEPYPHAAFAAMVERLDKYVGEIVSIIHEKGMDENTIIIFTSDNGPHKEGGGDPVFFNNTNGLRGIKRDLYEGGIREPMIIYWKGHIAAGGQSNHLLALWDFFPTILELSGIKQQSGIDGISLAPLILNGHLQPREYLYWELKEAGGKQAIRWGNWKGIRNDIIARPDGPLELYDLADDPFERNNVADKYPSIVATMEKFMRQAHVANKDWPLLPGE
jgi:arylsulfatase A-like enzyme